MVHPSIGIVTAVGEMHLETFGSIEGVLKTKFELIDALPASGLGVINIDSQPIADAHLKHHCNTITYSVENSDADYRATEVNYSPHATSFGVNVKGDVSEGYVTHLVGRGNILNLLAAIAVADELKVSASMQKRAIRQIEQIEHRLSIKTTAAGITIIDDAYNSNPAGAQMALEVLRDFKLKEGGRRIVVTPGFVEMGESQQRNNRILGHHIAASADWAFVVNKVNRDAIVQGLNEREFAAERLVIADSFAEASEKLAQMMTSGDVILYENDLPDSFK